MKPDITVVTISYNQAPFLRRALDSVLAHRDINIEYIVIDPGSSDGSRDIIEEYRDRLSHVIYEPDAGPADGLNKGLQLASADVFYYLNSDDEVVLGSMNEALRLFKKHPRVDVIYANGYAIDEGGDIIRTVYSSQIFTPRLYAAGLAVVVQQASFVRTDALKKVGGFNKENRTCWDGEALFDIAYAGGKLRRVWRRWGKFRIYPTTISGSGLFEQRIKQDHERICRKVSSSYRPPRRLERFLLWALVRLVDLARWPSYLEGSFRPAEAAQRQADTPKLKV